MQVTSRFNLYAQSASRQTVEVLKCKDVLSTSATSFRCRTLPFSDSYTHSLFSSCFLQAPDEFLCHGNGSAGEILSTYLAQETQELYALTYYGKLSNKN